MRLEKTYSGPVADIRPSKIFTYLQRKVETNNNRYRNMYHKSYEPRSILVGPLATVLLEQGLVSHSNSIKSHKCEF